MRPVLSVVALLVVSLGATAAGAVLAQRMELRREGAPQRLKPWYDSRGVSLAGAGLLDVEM